MTPLISRRTLLTQLPLAASVAMTAKLAFAAEKTFDMYSTAEQVTDGVNLRGKTAVVTGCNSGIGLETMRVLVLRGAHVIGTARSPEKAEEACKSVMVTGAKGRATPVVAEQTDYASVAACSDKIAAMGMPVDMLIANAGVAFLPELELVDGIEKHFAINHLSHFIFVNRLLPTVKKSKQGRVVIVGSVAHRGAPAGGIDFDNLDGHNGYDRFKFYAQSKLANGLHAKALAKRLAGTTTTVNVLHPGTIETPIFKYLDEERRPKAGAVIADGKEIIKTPAQGAATTCYVATSSSLKKVSGEYFSDCQIAVPSDYMLDAALAEKLWSKSEELTKPYLI